MPINTNTYASMSDLRLTEAITAFYLLGLADRNALQAHPALVYMGDAGVGGSLTKKASEIDWMGADQLSAVAEGASVALTALSDASYTVAVSRYAKAYGLTDLGRLTDIHGIWEPASVAQDAVASGAMTLTNLIAALASGFSQQVGSTGVNFTVQNFFDASALLDTNDVQGTPLAILHSRQWNDFRDALMDETGVLHVIPATAEQVQMRGSGFKGNYAGIDVFVSNQCATANSGADRDGMMFGRGAVLWASGRHKPSVGLVGMDINGGEVRLEFERDGKAAEETFITNRNLGVGEGIDLAGVRITTDA